MKRLVLTRLTRLGDRTLGQLVVYDGARELARFVTLELSYKLNKNKISCIPAGTYPIEPRESARFGHHLWVKDVPNRDLILIHNGCFPRNTQGCILVGMRMADIDGDGKLDVASSKVALAQLVQLVQEPAVLTIMDA